MGAASKLLSFLSTPLLLHHRRPSSLLLPLCIRSSFYSTCLRTSPPTILRPRITVRSFRAQPESATHADSFASPPGSAFFAHPWPEWSRLLSHISSAGFDSNAPPPYFSLSMKGDLSDEFVSAARVCLAFATQRPDLLSWLPRKDLEVLVENGSASLFEDGTVSARRLRDFLEGTDAVRGNEDRAQTVDVMRYLLSRVHASECMSDAGYNAVEELTNTSARNILTELVRLSATSGTSGFAESSARQPIQMKKGDWICPKCSFMNFARNTSCLECNEPRPRRVFAGGEWECPQCDFFNYGKNMSCLRCDCKRPYNPQHEGFSSNENAAVHTTIDPWNARQGEARDSFSSGSRNVGNKGVISNRTPDPAISEALQRILGTSRTSPTTRDQNVSDKFNVSDARSIAATPDAERENGASPGENIMDIMPMRKGENRFVVSKRKDRTPTSPPYRSRIEMEQGSNSNYVPFVPFPPGYFARKDAPAEGTSGQIHHPTGVPENSSGSSVHNNRVKENSSYVPPQPPPPTQELPRNGYEGGDRISSQARETGSNSYNYTRKSLEGSAVKEPDQLDMSQEAKEERFFRRVQQIKDISELANIPDEDFPDIMPMRKGVNRFVVSKRKTPLERRLTSDQYRRNLPIIPSEPKEDPS